MSKKWIYPSAIALAGIMTPVVGVMAQNEDPAAVQEDNHKPADVLDQVLDENARTAEQAQPVPAEEMKAPAEEEKKEEVKEEKKEESSPEQSVKEPAAEPAAASEGGEEDLQTLALPETEVIQQIVADTYVGDGGVMVKGFTVTVGDESVIAGLTAADFDIVNNVGSSTYYDPETDAEWQPLADDGLAVSVEGSQLKLSFTDFAWRGAGLAATPWEVQCLSNAALSFAADHEKMQKTTAIIDEAVIDKYQAAGLERWYALYLPKDDEGNVIENAPLVVWNHGGGEYGQSIDFTLVQNQGFTGWVENGEQRAVLMIQVANANYSWYTASDADPTQGGDLAEKIERQKLIDQNNALQRYLINDLVSKYHLDDSRIYVVGASSGGGATMRFVLQNPDLVAGAIADCSHDPMVWVHKNPNTDVEDLASKFEAFFQGEIYDWDEASQTMTARQIDTEQLLNLPIAFVHAENDPTCSVRSSLSMYKALQNLGARNNQLIVWDNAAMEKAGVSADALGGALLHWSWVPMLNNQDGVVDWLFGQKKTVDPECVQINAQTRIGDGQREAVSFEIVVKNYDAVKDLTAADFNIINNTPTTIFDPQTDTVWPEYADDEIQVTVSKTADGNGLILLSAKPFRYLGKMEADLSSSPWKVECLANPYLSFTSEEVTNVATRYVDDAIRGTWTNGDITREYILYLPKDAEGNTVSNAPLVLWNHGGGEYSLDIMDTIAANKGFTGWIDQQPTAVLMFQIANPNYSYFTGTDAPDYYGNMPEDREARRDLIDENNALQASFIRHLISTGAVDGSRIYITGASSGGGASMRFLMQNPDLAAAALVDCAMDPIIWVHFNDSATLDQLTAGFENAFQGEVKVWDEEQGKLVSVKVDTDALINVPITFVHAEKDGTCSVRSSQAMYAALNNLGAKDNHLKIWSNEEMEEAGISADAFGGALLHWSWVPMINNRDGLVDWLFAQSKPSPEPEPQPDPKPQPIPEPAPEPTPAPTPAPVPQGGTVVWEGNGYAAVVQTAEVKQPSKSAMPASSGAAAMTSGWMAAGLASLAGLISLKRKREQN